MRQDQVSGGVSVLCWLWQFVQFPSYIVWSTHGIAGRTPNFMLRKLGTHRQKVTDHRPIEGKVHLIVFLTCWHARFQQRNLQREDVIEWSPAWKDFQFRIKTNLHVKVSPNNRVKPRIPCTASRLTGFARHLVHDWRWEQTTGATRGVRTPQRKLRPRSVPTPTGQLAGLKPPPVRVRSLSTQYTDTRTAGLQSRGVISLCSDNF